MALASAEEIRPSGPRGASDAAEAAYTFEEVFCEEQREIQASRDLRCPGGSTEGASGHPGERIDLVGLAFSGGGIRSATFNLGIIQGIAEKGLLKRIDYLSTVSGGGYIGSWLTAWIRRQGCMDVEKALGENRPASSAVGASLEPQPVRFVRDFSNYLTPRTGAMSLDTWSLLAIYLRNLLLNLVLLTSISLCVLILPLILIAGFKLVGSSLDNLQSHRAMDEFIRALFWILTALSVAVAATTVGWGLMAFSDTRILKGWRRRVVEQGAKFNSLSILVALLFVTLLLEHGLAYPIVTVLHWMLQRAARLLPFSSSASQWLLLRANAQDSRITVEQVAAWMLLGAAAYLLFWTVALGPALRARAGEPADGPKSGCGDFRDRWTPFLVFTVVAGAVGGLLVFAAWQMLDWCREQMLITDANSRVITAPGDVALIILGPPLLMAAIVITQSIHIGLAGRGFDDARREWMARATGALMLTALAWLGVVGVAICGPVAMHFLASSRWSHDGWGRFATWILASGWAGTTFAGLGAGNAKSSSPVRRIFIRAAPYVFLAGLVFFLARGSDYVLGRMWWFGSTARGEVPEIKRPPSAEDLTDGFRALSKSQSLHQLVQAYDNTAEMIASVEGNSLHELAEHHWRTVENYSDSRLLVLFAIFAAITLILERRLDVNEFSMQLFYRNRLVRAYLGASKFRRSPHPFTGFSDADDVPLSLLRTTELRRKEPVDAEPELDIADDQPYDGPYPILGTALNIVHGKQLAWQSRKAASFIFTPKFCGYHFSAQSLEFNSPGFATAGYRRTERFAGGPTLGTALGISGAAASPNMGYHSTAAVSALMTICNVRMGWWVGNPRHPLAWRHKGPRSALSALLNELLAQTNDEGPYVYLSDGGHFENLGIYELVRRKCRYIIACDGAQDHEMNFGGLGDAIEKCRRDFGAEINIDVGPLRPRPNSRHSPAHYALGTIAYQDGETRGEILYIKSSLTGDESLDVTAYASANKAFPHDSTANQFFNESQFESYRALGQHIFRDVAARAGNSSGLGISTLFAALRSRQETAKAASG